MPLYPQPRERPSTRPRKPQPPPAPRDETGTPFPAPEPLSELQRQTIRRRHFGLPVKKDLVLLRDTWLHYRAAQQRALEEERYRALFRRPRGRRRQRHQHQHQQQKQKQEQEQKQEQQQGRAGEGRSSPPPCLRCALAGMPCSAALARRRDEVRCRRCERAGEEFCVRQAEDVTAGAVSDPAWLRGAAAAAAAAGEVEWGEDRLVVDPFRVGRDGREVWERECLVYCLDPVLGGDRRRLLDLAADMLHHGGAKYVHGTEVSPIHARRFALPMWHENGGPGNKRDPGHAVRMPVDYFKEVKARREEKRVELEMWTRKKKAEQAQEAQEAEKRRIEMDIRAEKARVEEAQRAKERLIKKEKDKVRKFYRDQGSAEDRARRKAELRRIFGEQLALGKKPFTDIAAYLEGLTDKYIEEIKLGLRTDLPF